MRLRQHIINEAAFRENEEAKQKILDSAEELPVTTYSVRRGADTGQQRETRGRIYDDPNGLWNDLGISSVNSGDVLAENLKSVIDGFLNGSQNSVLSSIFGGTKYVKHGKKLGVEVQLTSAASKGKSQKKNIAFWLWSTIMVANSINGVLKNVSKRYLRIEGISNSGNILVYMSRSPWGQ